MPYRTSGRDAGPDKGGIAHTDRLGVAACVAACSLAAVLSLFSPTAAQYVGLLTCVLCAAYARVLLPAGILIYAHAGSLVFASRALDTLSSDFVVYYDLFSRICSHGTTLGEGLFAFGPEIGLPLFYHLVSLVGGCGLSSNGLVYFQSVLVSFAALTLLCTLGVRNQSPNRAAMIVGGILILFSFEYVTQLSRQTASSVFVIAALLASRRRRTVVTLLICATMFHLTAPLVYGIAAILRSASRVLIVGMAITLAAIIASGPTLLALAIEHADTVVGFAKLTYYAQGVEHESMVGSDIRAVLYLLAAGLVSLPLSTRARPALTRDARMLLGFAFVATSLLPLPLAATRLTLAFSSLAIGYFLFKPLATRYPHLSIAILVAAILFRSGIFNVFGPPEQALWQAYPSSSLYPGYFVQAF